MTGFRWNTLRDWVKVARELPRTRGHYPDGPLVAFVFAICKAAEQPEPGTFDSVPILRAILDATGSRRGRHVAFLIEQGDIVVGPDGRATIPNWRPFQDEGKSTPRVQKHRGKQAGNVSGNGRETLQGAFQETDMERLAGAPPRRDSLTGVEPSIDGESTSVLDSARNGAAEEPYRTLEELTDHFPVQRVEPNAIRTLDALTDRRGVPAVVAALRESAPGIPTQPPGPWQLIAAARNLLEPFAAPAKASATKGQVQPIDEILEAIRGQ